MTKKRILKKKAKQNESTTKTNKLKFFATETWYHDDTDEEINEARARARARAIMESGRYDF